MTKRKITLFALCICLFAGIALVKFAGIESFLRRGDVSENPSASASDRQSQNDPQHPLRSPLHRKDGSGLTLFPGMASGTPSAVMPYPRGENLRRSYSTVPVSRTTADLGPDSPAPGLALLPDDGRIELQGDEIDNHTLKGLRMVFNHEAIDQVIAGNANRLSAPTPNGDLIELDIKSINTRSSRTHTLEGNVAGQENDSYVQIVYHDGIIFGSVARYPTSQHLEYRILESGYMMVRELDHKTMTADCVKPGAQADTAGCKHDSGCSHNKMSAIDQLQGELAQEGINIQSLPQNGEALPETPGAVTIDVVVGYDRAARIADGGVSQIEARIVAAIDQMNTAFVNSQITNTEMMLLGTIEDPDYVFPGKKANDIVDELDGLNNTVDGYLDAVTDYATELGADFHSFVIKETEGGAAGVAYLGDDTSITARDYMTLSRLTFAHELGHNFGCDHSWGDSSADYHDRYGWRFDPDGSSTTTSDRVRTIMAYDWNWGTGQRVLHYANPAVKYASSNAYTGAANGSNVTGNGYVDQRYVNGGLSGFGVTGFNGTHSTLGARNALNILNGTGQYGRIHAAAYKTRTAANVVTPVEGQQYYSGQYMPVYFHGGDHTYTATIQLYKADVLIATIASGLSAANDRRLDWLIPSGYTDGNDYLVRVTLEHSTNPDIVFDSGFFTIGEADPRILSHTPSPTPSPINSGEITFNFSEVMDPASFSLADDIRSFTGPRGIDLKSTITGFSWSANDTKLTVSFTSQSNAGYYRMVIGPMIADLAGNYLDQDLDELDGELVDDTYIAIVGLDGSGPGVIWSDMIGNDSPDSDWRFPVSGSWQKGMPTETPPSGPNAGADGGQIIASKLSGSYGVDEKSHTIMPTIDCSTQTGVALRCKIWYGAEIYDKLYIECWNGSAWVRVFEITGTDNGSNSGEWVTLSGDVSEYADGNPAFRIRWGLEDVSIGRDHEEGTGWQIDAVEILGDTPTEPIPAPVIVNDFTLGDTSDPKSSLFFEFSSPMNDTTFGLGDVVSFSGPSGDITPSGSDWISDSLLRVDFPEQTVSGTYTVVMGPTIQDNQGSEIDQDLDGIAGETTDDSYTATFIIGDGSDPYTSWTLGTFANPFTSKGTGDNPDGDLWINYVEFAFGTDPTTAASGVLTYVVDGNITTLGMPIIEDTGSGMRIVFARRKEYLTAGLGYTVEFSHNLADWASVATTPTLLTSVSSSGDYDVVCVEFPALLNIGGSDQVPAFGRVEISYGP